MADRELVLVPVGEWDPSLWSEKALTEALDFGRYRISRVDGSIKLIISDDQIGKENQEYDINKQIKLLEERFGVEFILVKKIIGAEKGYIRRTAEEFAAGAEPVRGGGSHRMSNVGLPLTDELREATKATAEAMGVKYTNWMRAALRKALREGVDVEMELATPIEVEIPQPVRPDRD